MKRVLAILLALAMAFSLAACGESGSGGSSNEPVKKEILPLIDMRTAPFLGIEQTEPQMMPADISFANLHEMEEQAYKESEALKPFADFAEEKLGVKLDERWNVFVHYYTDDEKFGMVEFQYQIGRISTNKNILFGIENGKVNVVYYHFLDSETDETALLERVAKFELQYEQEKYQLKDGEKFESEDVKYVYYYDLDYLVYAYAAFFSNEMGLINNDFGTECLIDENGDAKFTPMDKGFDSTVSYANWTEDSAIYTKALNASKMAENGARKLPIYKFDTLNELKKFKSDFGKVLAMDSRHDEMPSFNEATAKYNEAFFNESTLMLVYVSASSGSYRFGVNSVSCDGNSLCVHIKRLNNPEIGTADMAGWFITVAIPDNIVANYSEFDADMDY